MSDYAKFLRQFMSQKLELFTRPLPQSSQEFNERYSLVTMDWHAIQKESSSYRMSPELSKNLRELFGVVERFVWKLKGSRRDYASQRESLSAEWRQIQALASKILTNRSY